MKLGKPLQTLMVNEVKSRYSNKIGINYPQNYNGIDFWVGGEFKIYSKKLFHSYIVLVHVYVHFITMVKKNNLYKVLSLSCMFPIVIMGRICECECTKQ